MKLRDVQIGGRFILTDGLQFHNRNKKIHVKDRVVFQLLDRTDEMLTIGVEDGTVKFNLKDKDAKSWNVATVTVL